jgi:hypothetical protein
VTTNDLGGYLVLPLVWLAYTLVRGEVADWYPYPFIDVQLHGYGRVALACLGVAALILALGWLCRCLDPRLPGLRAAEASGSSAVSERTIPGQ